MASSPETAPRLLVMGSLNLDLVGRAPHIPGPGETVLGESLHSFHGGKGGNQAVAAARLGARVSFAGAVGDDAAGAALRQGLEAAGIDTAALRRVAGASGHALITVAAGGENAITVLPGANARMGGPQPGDLQGVALLALQMEVPAAAVRAWAEAARALGIAVLLNAAPMSEAAAALLPAVDVLVVNEGELQALVGMADDLPAQLQRAAARGPRVVVATLGAQGAVAWLADEARLLRCPARPVAVVDTTGAGDTFVGALAAARLRGAAWPQALEHANAAAALSCTRAGAREGMPDAQALAAFLHPPAGAARAA